MILDENPKMNAETREVNRDDFPLILFSFSFSLYTFHPEYSLRVISLTSEACKCLENRKKRRKQGCRLEKCDCESVTMPRVWFIKSSEKGS